MNALTTNLSPTLLPDTPQNFYAGKMETFLTCRAVNSLLKSRLPDDAQAPAKFFEEASLKAIRRSITGMSLADARLLIRELPNLLTLPYPAAEELRAAMLQVVVPQMMNTFRLNIMWKDYVDMEYVMDVLKLIKE